MLTVHSSESRRLLEVSGAASGSGLVAWSRASSLSYHV